MVLGEAEVFLEEAVFLEELGDLSAVDLEGVVEGLVKPLELNLAGLGGKAEGGEGLGEIDLGGADRAYYHCFLAGGQRVGQQPGELGVPEGDVVAE